MARLFYGWRMVGAATGMQVLQAALVNNAFGAYVAVLTEERGWSKTALSGAAALQQAEAAILGPVLGWLLDRFGPAVFIRAGIFVFGGGLMLLSTVDSLGGFYAAFIVIALGGSLAGFFPLNVALIHWFERFRARALSAMSLGIALGGLATPAIAWSLQTYGWRPTAFWSGVLAIVIGFPLALVMRNRPEDHGLKVDGLPDKPAEDLEKTIGGTPRPATRDFTAREALRTRAFWLLSLGHGFALFTVHTVLVHAITHLKEGLGYSIAAAAMVMALVTAFQVVGVMLGWWIGDRWDKRRISAACMLAHAFGLLLLTYAFDVWMLVAFAVLHGTAWGLRGPFMQAIRADYFGRAAIGMILGLSYTIIIIGQIGGPMIAGVMADASGNYRGGFTLLAVLAGLGSLFFLFAKKPARPAR
jgi:sugar phosphate permease